MMFQMSITIGILVANLVNYFFEKIEGGWGWRLSLGGAGVPALIIIVGAIFLPETPNSLIERGKTEEAREQLKAIRGIPNVDQEFDDLVIASEASQRVNHPWKSLLSRKYRPQLSFAILIPALQQLTGVNVVIFYAPVLFKTVGFGNEASLMSAVITGLVNCFATLISIFTVDKVGRRKLFLEGGIQMFIFQVIKLYKHIFLFLVISIYFSFYSTLFLYMYSLLLELQLLLSLERLVILGLWRSHMLVCWCSS